MLNHKVEKEEDADLIGLQTKSGYSSSNLPFPKLNIATQEGNQWVLLHTKGLSQPKQRKKKKEGHGPRH